MTESKPETFVKQKLVCPECGCLSPETCDIDALRAELAQFTKQRDEIAKAARRVNMAAFDLYSDIVPAVKALEAILARQKEKSK